MNNLLKVNIVEQQNDSKEKCNKNDKDKVQIISGAETPRKIINMCVSHVTKMYREKKILKNHIIEGHTSVSLHFPCVNIS